MYKNSSFDGEENENILSDSSENTFDRDYEGFSIQTAQEMRSEILKKITRNEKEIFVSFQNGIDVSFEVDKTFELYSKLKNFNKVILDQIKQLQNIPNGEKVSLEEKRKHQNEFTLPHSNELPQNSQNFNNFQNIQNIQNYQNTHHLQQLQNKEVNLPAEKQNKTNSLATNFSSFNKPSFYQTETHSKNSEKFLKREFSPLQTQNQFNNQAPAEFNKKPIISKPELSPFEEFTKFAVLILEKTPRMTLSRFDKEYNFMNSFGTVRKIEFMKMRESELKSLFERIPGVQVQWNASKSEFNVIKFDLVCFPFRKEKFCECGLDCDRRKGEVAMGWRTTQCEFEKKGKCRFGASCNMLHTKTLYANK